MTEYRHAFLTKNPKTTIKREKANPVRVS